MTRNICLVTGAAGFIGSHLVRALVARGAQVHGIVRPGSLLDRLHDLRADITLHELDLRDHAALKACVAAVAPHKVFHLAANTRDVQGKGIAQIARSFSDYLDPFMHLLDVLTTAASPPAVLVRAGSIAEYGRAAVPYREDQREYPLTPYSARMLAATHLCEMLSGSLPFAVHTARLALTYGEGQAHSFLLPALLDACCNGLPTTIQRPDDRRDLIHVDDVVAAMIRLGERVDASTTVNIATGIAPTMREMAEAVIALTGCDPQLVTFASPPPIAQPSVLLASPAKAQVELGWSAQVRLDQGLAMMLGSQLQATPEARLRCG